jgi:hypothetical protein
MTFSMVPFLFLAQLAAFSWAVRAAWRHGCISAGGAWQAAAVLLALTLWGLVSGYLAATGVYRQEWFLAAWPSFWITGVAVAILAAPLLFAPLRETVRGIIDVTPLKATIALQALRVFAIGGIAKGLSGEFSYYYALTIGVPDFLFGLSALAILAVGAGRELDERAIAIWHLIGALIIVPPGMVLLQMGLPGAWQVFTAEPTIATIFAFPMALAPTLVVPTFIAANLLVAVRIFERRQGAAAVGAQP